ncbi:MAG: hypothetical protein Q7K11_00860 [Candidatus Berkelbacteria bacterium]|nr:hypothetical protein [Candidatus Berkelbacteria bacterium]
MDKDDKSLREIRRLLEEAEGNLSAAKRILFEQVYKEQAGNLDLNHIDGPSTIVEGVFDGEEMIDKAGRKYPVPVNYSSKSKLVPGDSLKLTISSDGTFIFKQIGPIERKKLTGKLSKSGERWHVTCEGKKYNCLPASITYYKAEAGDKMTIIVPKTGEAEWAAIENLLEKGKTK